MVNKFLDAVKDVLYEIGNFIVENASVIADALLGVGLAYAIYRGVTRALPIVRRIFSLGI